MKLFLCFIVTLFSIVSGFQKSSQRWLQNKHNNHLTLYTTSSSTEVLDTKPKWASGGIVSDIVNALISFKPLFSVMKLGARKTLIDTAEKNGIEWRKTVSKYESISDTLQQSYFNKISQPSSYPSYYTQEFHAYDEGNLNWQAAYECESATMSMALRVWPKEELTAVEAQDRLRSSFLNAVKSYAKEKNIKSFSSIIDIGCSVGISTFYLAKEYSEVKNILGLDLSPHFLSIAQHRQKQISSSGRGASTNIADDQLNSYDRQFTRANIERIQWSCQNAENTNYPTGSFDLTAISFMFHELPQQASDDILREMFRVTAPGGMIAITDNNPRSPVIQGKEIC